MDRYRAYRDVMREAGLTPQEAWLIGQPGYEIDARFALRSSIDGNSSELQEIGNCIDNAAIRPTAILAVHDYLAVLTIRALQALGLRVPNDLSVAGFDDTDPAVHLEVPLTTVAQDPFTIGKTAARRLLDRIEGYDGPVECELIPTQLRVRSSTAVPVLV
jgi:DNA-binding LacI/PurR family transcriptional regulator